VQQYKQQQEQVGGELTTTKMALADALQQRATLVIQKMCRQHMARTKRKQDARSLLSIVQCARHKDRASMQDMAHEITGLKAIIAQHEQQHASTCAILSNQCQQELQHQREALVKEYQAAAKTTPATSTKPPSSKAQRALATRLKVSLRSAMERNAQARDTIASMKSEIHALKQANRTKTNEGKDLQERMSSKKAAKSVHVVQVNDVQHIAMMKKNSDNGPRCSGGGSGGGWTTPTKERTSPRLQVSPGHTRTFCSAPFNDDGYLDRVEASVNEAILVSIALQNKKATKY
jgi:FtsZ-binding cell division protein ZapB